MTTMIMNEVLTGNWLLLDRGKHLLTRPKTLIEGEHYLYREGNQIGEPEMYTVKFTANTSCPGIVVVSNAAGQRVRCPRYGLFQLTDENEAGIIGAKNEPG